MIVAQTNGLRALVRNQGADGGDRVVPFRHLCQVILVLFSIILVVPVLASGATLTLNSNVPSGQTVGTSIQWTTTAQAGMVYQYSVAYSTGPYFVMRDASASNTFSWTPLQEGSYTV